MKLVSFFLILTSIGNQVTAQDTVQVVHSVVVDTLKDTMITVPLASSTSLQDSIKRRESTPNGQHIDAMIKYAKTFLGTPYRYAGTTPSGFDCSGFINYVMGDFGFELTRTSYGLAELGQTVRLSEVRPGDLLFFKGRNVNSTSVGHVGMVVEVVGSQIKMIHSSTSRGVVVENFNASSYYVPRFIKAKRLDYGVK